VLVTIACVNVGNYRLMGARYVNTLFRGCSRNLTVPFRFVCLTDDGRGLLPEIEPRKIQAGLIPPQLHPVYTKMPFSSQANLRTEQRVVFLDLDMVILANIDDLARIGVSSRCSEIRRAPAY
jgi:hypothetical protein